MPVCALSSVVEHYLHTVGVAGSKPAARTIFGEVEPFPASLMHSTLQSFSIGHGKLCRTNEVKTDTNLIKNSKSGPRTTAFNLSLLALGPG
jgi:hypothetical protein